MRTFRHNDLMNATVLPPDAILRITREQSGLRTMDGTTIAQLFEITLGEAVKNGDLKSHSGTVDVTIELSPRETRIGEIEQVAPAIPSPATYPEQGTSGAPDLTHKNSAIITRRDGQLVALTGRDDV